MPMNLHMLSLVVHLSELAASLPGEFRDLAEPVRLPGCVPILGPDIVSSLQDRFDPSYVVMLHLVVRCREAAEAILINSFDAIKPEAVEVLRHPAKSGGHQCTLSTQILQAEPNDGGSVDVDFLQREEAERRERGDGGKEVSWGRKKWGGGDLLAAAGWEIWWQRRIHRGGKVGHGPPQFCTPFYVYDYLVLSVEKKSKF
jgi:hypothetical protein